MIQENIQSDEEKFVPEKLEAQKGPIGSEDAYDDREAIEAVRVKNLELKNKEEEIEKRSLTLDEALQENPISLFQYRILLMCGLAFMVTLTLTLTLSLTLTLKP